MEKSAKEAFNFLIPFVLILFTFRLGLDILIKQMEWGYRGQSMGTMLALGAEIAFIFFVINRYKSLNNNELLFSQGVRIGVGLMLLFGILFTSYLIIYGKYINPNYEQGLIEEAKQFMLSKDPNAKVELLNKKPNSNTLIGFSQSLIKYIIIGAFGAVISSAILKTEK